MCFSKTESLAALGFGTAVNAAVAATVMLHPAYRATRWFRLTIVLMWQFALLMQIPEAVQWHHLDRGLPTPGWVNPLAYWLNNLQPLVAYVGMALAVGLTTDLHQRQPAALGGAAVVPLLFTLLALLYYPAAMREQQDIRPLPQCNHLDLHWWQHGLRPWIGFYLLGVLSAMALLPGRHKYIQAAVFLGTFALATTLYKCGAGSVWCWTIAPAGLTALL